jgi:uncharacterized membrane protein HdeD (DUF308 family)
MMNEVSYYTASEIAPAEFRPRWGWFVTLGIVLLVLAATGLVAVVAATRAAMFALGLLMLIGSFAEIMHGFQVKRGAAFAFWLLGGLVYGVAGIATLYNPLMAAVTMTLVLAGSLIILGILRIALSLGLRGERGWGPMLASGAITVIVGIIFLAGWPGNSLVLPGAMLVLDLAIQGVTAIAAGVALKAAR